MKAILFATVASTIARAFMSDVTEVVLIKGPGGKPLRVNKSDYDADQAEGGAKAMTLHKDDAEQPVPDGAMAGEPAPGIIPHPIAAPSRADFTGGGEITPPVKDPTKDAVAPAAPSPNARLVGKEGTGKNTKYFVVDGTGTKLEIDGIDPAGYPTEKNAWDAIMALPH